MPCLEAAFARGILRLEVDQDTTAGITKHVVHMAVADIEARTLRPLMADAEHRAVVYGDTEALAVNSALAYLERAFGAFEENAHGCDPAAVWTVGEPLIVASDTR